MAPPLILVLAALSATTTDTALWPYTWTTAAKNANETTVEKEVLSYHCRPESQFEKPPGPNAALQAPPSSHRPDPQTAQPSRHAYCTYRSPRSASKLYTRPHAAAPLDSR